MKKILIVCTGNTCRSPMGEAILKNHLKSIGKEAEYDVQSGGLMAYPDQPASENAVIAMRELDIDLSSHRARSLSSQDLQQADAIYVMTSSHKDFITKSLADSNGKIHILHVEDPYGGPIDNYRQCRDAMLSFFQKEFPADNT